MRTSKITVVDYGMGNLWSVLNALRYLGCEAETCSDPAEVERADALILPGVGSFGRAMERLHDSGLDQAIVSAVKGRGRKILGICLGLQLMGTRGSEDGEHAGLGLIEAPVERFRVGPDEGFKVPHVGFNTVSSFSGSQLFRDLPPATDFYFVHSFRMPPDGLDGRVSTCTHGETFVAAYEHENVFAAQFHPEKSQTNGLILLRNFLDA